MSPTFEIEMVVICFNMRNWVYWGKGNQLLKSHKATGSVILHVKLLIVDEIKPKILNLPLFIVSFL